MLDSTGSIDLLNRKNVVVKIINIPLVLKARKGNRASFEEIDKISKIIVGMTVNMWAYRLMMVCVIFLKRMVC